jgi:hypothetical protein
MNTDQLKEIINLLNNTTVQAKTAFFVWLGYNLLVDLLVEGSILFVIVYITRTISNHFFDNNCLYELYQTARKKVGKEPTRNVWSFEVKEVINLLEKK